MSIFEHLVLRLSYLQQPLELLLLHLYALE
jgi:hypothetical protein